MDYQFFNKLKTFSHKHKEDIHEIPYFVQSNFPVKNETVRQYKTDVISLINKLNSQQNNKTSRTIKKLYVNSAIRSTQTLPTKLS